MSEKSIGKVMDFFAHPVVAGIELSTSIKVGDAVHIKGATTDIQFVIDSLQVNNTPVNKASRGQQVGIKVIDRVRRGDVVYRVT